MVILLLGGEGEREGGRERVRERERERERERGYIIMYSPRTILSDDSPVDFCSLSSNS